MYPPGATPPTPTSSAPAPKKKGAGKRGRSGGSSGGSGGSGSSGSSGGGKSSSSMHELLPDSDDEEDAAAAAAAMEEEARSSSSMHELPPDSGDETPEVVDESKATLTFGGVEMRMVAIKQPWLNRILNEGKDVENRATSIGQTVKVGGDRWVGRTCLACCRVGRGEWRGAALGACALGACALGRLRGLPFVRLTGVCSCVIPTRN